MLGLVEIPASVSDRSYTRSTGRYWQQLHNSSFSIVVVVVCAAYLLHIDHTAS